MPDSPVAARPAPMIGERLEAVLAEISGAASLTAAAKELAETFVGARIWGPSARFEGQKVGREHLVRDGDAVEILKPM